VPLCGGVQCHTLIWVCITRSRCSECNSSTRSCPAGQYSRPLSPSSFHNCLNSVSSDCCEDFVTYRTDILLDEFKIVIIYRGKKCLRKFWFRNILKKDCLENREGETVVILQRQEMLTEILVSKSLEGLLGEPRR
jgi:hypothetical protein